MTMRMGTRLAGPISSSIRIGSSTEHLREMLWGEPEANCPAAGARQRSCRVLIRMAPLPAEPSPTTVCDGMRRVDDRVQKHLIDPSQQAGHRRQVGSRSSSTSRTVPKHDRPIPRKANALRVGARRSLVRGLSVLRSAGRPRRVRTLQVAQLVSGDRAQGGFAAGTARAG